MLGLAAVQWINPLLLALYRWLLVGEILLWVLLALLAADIAGTVLTLCGVRSSLPPLENLNSRLAALSVRPGVDSPAAEERIRPTRRGLFPPAGKDHCQPLCPGGQLLQHPAPVLYRRVAGDLAETIFCRLKMGWWMSQGVV